MCTLIPRQVHVHGIRSSKGVFNPPPPRTKETKIPLQIDTLGIISDEQF